MSSLLSKESDVSWGKKGGQAVGRPFSAEKTKCAPAQTGEGTGASGEGHDVQPLITCEGKVKREGPRATQTGSNPALKDYLVLWGAPQALSTHLRILFALQTQMSFRNTHSTDSISTGKSFHNV